LKILTDSEECPKAASEFSVPAFLLCALVDFIETSRNLFKIFSTIL
jgi:hypothetical protein